MSSKIDVLEDFSHFDNHLKNASGTHVHQNISVNRHDC